MAKGAHLKKLFQSVKDGNMDTFKQIAEAIIEDEKIKSHAQLAGELQKILDSPGFEAKPLKQTTVNHFHLLPKDKDSNNLLLEMNQSQTNFDNLVLNDSILQSLYELVKEFEESDVLSAYGLSSKNKFLFCGPPGCGKTVTAKAISGELNIPILYTRFDSVISSYLGETASNLRKIFDFASSGNWILFFDEFDAIAKKRDSIDEHGELKRVVNTFLQLLDSFQGDSIIIAATNHQSLLDPAIWRRFDDVLLFPLPNESQIKDLLNRNLNRYPHARIDTDQLSKMLIGFSHADIERICVTSIKKAIIMRYNQLSESLILEEIEKYKSRYEIYNALM